MILNKKIKVTGDPGNRRLGHRGEAGYFRRREAPTTVPQCSTAKLKSDEFLLWITLLSAIEMLRPRSGCDAEKQKVGQPPAGQWAGAATKIKIYEFNTNSALRTL